MPIPRGVGWTHGSRAQRARRWMDMPVAVRGRGTCSFPAAGVGHSGIMCRADVDDWACPEEGPARNEGHPHSRPPASDILALCAALEPRTGHVQRRVRRENRACPEEGPARNEEHAHSRLPASHIVAICAALEPRTGHVRRRDRRENRACPARGSRLRRATAPRGPRSPSPGRRRPRRPGRRSSVRGTAQSRRPGRPPPRQPGR